jgi:hypothetical protein
MPAAKAEADKGPRIIGVGIGVIRTVVAVVIVVIVIIVVIVVVMLTIMTGTVVTVPNPMAVIPAPPFVAVPAVDLLNKAVGYFRRA